MRPLAHHLVPPTDDVGAYHQGTLLVAACVVTGLFAAFYAVVDATFGLWVGAGVMAAAAVLFLGLAPVFGRTGSVPLVAHSFLAVGTVAVVVNAHVAGGAEVLAWLAIVPLAAVLLTDGHRGVVWGGVAVGLAVLFAVLEGAGYAYPVSWTPRDRPVWTALVRGGLPLLVYLLALVFCRERTQALATIGAQKAEIQDALDRLEEAQARLVQRETLAALGQVTAGIAHEVMNPLNFVTNFSTLNQELAADLRAALDAGDRAEATALAAELEANAERVHHHGERADAIVRSMSAVGPRTAGPRRRVGVNGLVAAAVARAAADAGAGAPVPVEEAYDGYAGTADLAPDEVGQAVRHVVANAIDAARAAAPRRDGPPRVRVETAREGDRVLVRVRDNGPGIAADLRDRVFEPFYTTKPPGEGTGLGLTLAYDVVVGRHGGALELDSAAGEGTMVTVSLPASAAPRPAPPADDPPDTPERVPTRPPTTRLPS